MTVSENADILQKPWQGYRNAQFPIGAWDVNQAVTGDGSGGQQQVNIFMRPAATDFQAMAYSIERLSISHTDNTARSGTIGSGGFSLDTLQSFSLSSTATVAAIRDFDRIFLGVAAKGASLALVTFLIVNVDLSIFSVLAEGYVWGQRSIAAEGGYQVPPSTPWGRA